MVFPRKARMGLGLILIVAAAFAVTYWARGPDTELSATGPDLAGNPDVTPVPGTTPDTSQPGWYQPYINEDAKKPRFVGTIAGVQIDPNWTDTRTGYDMCPGTGLTPPLPSQLLSAVTGTSGAALDLRRIPSGLTTVNEPSAFLCGSDLFELSWTFRLALDSTRGAPSGGIANVYRIRGNVPVTLSAPKERYQEVDINGQIAVLLPPIVTSGSEQFGGCTVAVYDPADDITTKVYASAVADFCIELLKGVLR